MKRAEEQISQIKFGSRILQAGQELTLLPQEQRARPDISKVKLHAQERVAEIKISDQVLEKNIEQSTMRQTITFSVDDFADIGAATDKEIATVINRQIYGGKAEMEEMLA